MKETEVFAILILDKILQHFNLSILKYYGVLKNIYASVIFKKKIKTDVG